MTLKQFGVWAILAFLLLISNLSLATVLTFEDLTYDFEMTGSDYSNIQWDHSTNPGISFKQGEWVSRFYNPAIDDPENNLFGTHNLANSYGCTKIAFQFPEANFPNGVIVYGAHFNGMGNEYYWPASITVTGVMDGQEVWDAFLDSFTANPQWLSMNQDAPVEKIVITVTPKYDPDPEFNVYGYFGMDNLTFEEVIIPEPATLLMLGLGVIGIYRRK